MRPLEITVLLLEMLALLPLGGRLSRYLPLAAAIAVAAHLGLEGYRWQMVPAYALAAILLARTLLRWRRPAAPRRLSAWRAGLSVFGAVLLMGVVAAAPSVFPVPRLPEPGGPYKIGTLSFDWTDPAREEAYTDVAGDKREIMVQVWYPAAPEPGAQTGPWMERLDVAGPTIARYLHFPDFLLDHTALIRTDAYPDAPIAPGPGRYPVVIYSHGWNGFRTVNLDEVEALASHGYVVVSIDHTYGAMITVFSDGRVALNRPQALPADDAPEAVAQPIREQLVGTYTADVRFVLDQLEKLDAGALESRLAGHLDLGRVGLFGHSTGGGAVVLVCSQDARCRAGVGLDAWLVPLPQAAVDAGLDQPFLFLWSEVWSSARNDARLAQLTPGLRGGYQSLTILGTRHYDFTLLPLLTPLAPALKLKGPLDGARVMRIVDDYLLAFFDQALKGQPAPLLAGPSAAYPEVVYEAP